MRIKDPGLTGPEGIDPWGKSGYENKNPAKKSDLKVRAIAKKSIRKATCANS